MLKCLVSNPQSCTGSGRRRKEVCVWGVVKERFDLSKARGWEALLVALFLHTKEENVGREKMSVI